MLYKTAAMAWNARPLIFYVFPGQVHYTLQQQTTLIVMTHLWETRHETSE